MFWDLNFPTEARNLNYRILLSATGVGPTNYGVDIPLTSDSYTVASFTGRYPVNSHNNMHGQLSVFGRANATLNLPAGMPTSLIGSRFYFAAVASPTGALPAYSSIAIEIVIVP